MSTTYYLFSGSHTHKDDEWLTFWRPDGRGYCWYKEWIGSYPKPATECEIEDDYNHGNVYIDPIIADKLFVPVSYEGKIFHVILNTKENRLILGFMSKGELCFTGYNKTNLGEWTKLDEEEIKLSAQHYQYLVWASDPKAKGLLFLKPRKTIGDDMAERLFQKTMEPFYQKPDPPRRRPRPEYKPSGSMEPAFIGSGPGYTPNPLWLHPKPAGMIIQPVGNNDRSKRFDLRWPDGTIQRNVSAYQLQEYKGLKYDLLPAGLNAKIDWQAHQPKSFDAKQPEAFHGKYFYMDEFGLWPQLDVKTNTKKLHLNLHTIKYSLKNNPTVLLKNDKHHTPK